MTGASSRRELATGREYLHSCAAWAPELYVRGGSGAALAKGPAASEPLGLALMTWLFAGSPWQRGSPVVVNVTVL